ncbi:uncharacterized protein LOC119720425 [Patiria miniata]|uniref:Apple domain-containing protein n=1 Tax=Patiria miniata TaxID=46514 RepID=A0A913Z2G1_PATMI|nr:uncharacterized protein LOC119720425 [Patiria miniata]
MLKEGNRLHWRLGSEGDMCLLFLVTQLCCFQYVHCGFRAISLSGKPTSQSTTHSSPFPSYKAIDGIPSTFAHTIDDGGDPHPWWKIDLQNEHCVGQITVQIRLDCCGLNRFLGTVVRAGLSANYAENRPCSSPATAAQSSQGTVTEFPCDTPRMARYVSLDIDPSSSGVTTPILQIAELTVEEHTTIRACDPRIIQSTKFERLHKKGLIDNPNPLSTKTTRSLTTCADLCTKETDCFSFDFGKSLKQCRLYNLNSTDIVMTPNDEFAVYSALN